MRIPFLIIVLLFPFAPINADTASPNLVLPLWPEGRMPGNKADKPEMELPSKEDHPRRITNIRQPDIALFQPVGAVQPSPAVLICPGGGYGLLSYEREGTEIAAWLQSNGMTGVVLKYRVPKNQAGAFQDIQRAVRIVRSHAEKWKISQIGVLGFSAGGHLCARLSNNFKQPAYSKIDAADGESCRPDFAILVYPAYLASNGTLAPELPVSAETPPTFLIHTEDDRSFIAGSKIYSEALDAAQVPHEFFLRATGGHGYGMRSTKEAGAWPQQCLLWLKKMCFLEKVQP